MRIPTYLVGLAAWALLLPVALGAAEDDRVPAFLNAPVAGWAKDADGLQARIRQDSTLVSEPAEWLQYCSLSVKALPIAKEGNNWKVLAVQMLDDAGGVWQVALISAPTDALHPDRHMMDIKRTGARGEKATYKLRSEYNRNIPWRYNYIYTLTLIAEPDRVEGIVRDAEDRVLYQAVYVFTGGTPPRFRPALRVRQMQAQFADWEIKTSR